MITIDVRDNIGLVISRLGATRTEVVNGAVPRALNKTATTVRAEASKEIRKVYSLKAKVVKDQIKIKRATRSVPTAIISASGKRIALFDFGAKQVGKGVSVLVKKGSRKIIRSAFIAQVGSHTGVFARGKYVGGQFAFRKKRIAKYPRNDLPINELFSLSLPQMFTAKTIFNSLVKVARARFPVVFAQEVRFALSKR